MKGRLDSIEFCKRIAPPQGMFAGLAIAGALGFALPLHAQSGNQQIASRSSSGGGQCIPASARQAVDQCPGGTPNRGRPPRGATPRSRLRTAARAKASAKKMGPTGPSVQIDAATARGRQKIRARAWQLLQREVRVLKRLVQNTPKTNAQRPDILLRLAETYFEMQQALTAQVRSFDDPIFRACRKQKNRAKCSQARNRQKQATARLKSARQDAIRTYAMLIQDHPNFRRMDEVMFSLAFGLEELRQHDRARQVYHRLIKNYPQSRFIPHAYLSFAEFFFNDGDMRAALQFYNKVIEFPPSRNRVYGYAVYKSAWAHYNREDYRAALQKFVETVEFATQHPNSPDASNLARQARREMVLPYAQVGTPDRALEFFRRYSKDEDQALGTFENLGELYFDTGKWPATISVYHKLIAERPRGNKLCYWQSRVTNAIISSKPKADQVRELERMVDVYDSFSSRRRPAEALAQCKNETAGILAWLATSWHRETVGTDTQPGTNDKKTMGLSARLYRLLVEKFPNMDDIKFPNIDRRDWPTAYKVAYYHAELLWKMEEWAQCGPAFDKVVELNPRGEFTSDAAYAAVLCYNNLYQQQYQGREREVRTAEKTRRRGRRKRDEPEQSEEDKYKKRPFTQLEQGMLRAFSRYVCFVNKSDDLAQVKYRRARIFYEANHYEEAAVVFRDIAWNHRESDLAEYAANLYLDSLNILGTKTEPVRTECVDELGDAIDPLSDFYCKTESAREEHSDLCGVLGQLQCDVLRKKAESFEKSKKHKEAAATYVRIFRRYRECGKLDEVLYNAAINFEAARLLGRAIQVRNVLIERFEDSQWAKRSVYLVGANFHALAFYEQAASYYERFAKQFPGEDGSKCSEEDKEAGVCPVAHEALQNAVFFRIGLGETEAAEANARLFAKNYRRKRPQETSQVVFSIGTIYERSENWQEVARHYKKFLKDYRRIALPHQIIRANVMLAKAYWNTNDKRKAQGFFKAAVSTWQRGAASRILGQADVSDADRITQLKEALDSAAEALFYLAEYRYEEFKAVRFPTYRGGRSLDRVNKWAKGDFAKWVNQKMAALRSAETEYNKIAEVKVVVREGLPPLESPPWQIASAARIGQMYRSFVDAFRDAPIPTEIENDPDLFDVYVGALDEQSEPLQKQAISKFEFCLTTATNVRWFNDWSRTCEQELNGLNPRRYPLAAELRGNASYVHGTVGRPGAVKLGGGSGGSKSGNAAGGGS